MKLLQLIFLLVSVFLSAGVQAQKDSLWCVYHSQTDTTQINTLLKLAKIYLEINKDSVIALTHTAIHLAEKEHFPIGTAKAVAITGLYYQNKSDYDSAIHFFRAATTIYEDLGDSVEYAQNINSLAGVYYVQGNYQRALEYLLIALKIHQRRKDNPRIARCLNNLALIYKKNKEYDKAIQMHKQAILMKTELQDSLRIANGWVNISSTYIEKNNPDSAIISLDNGFEMVKKLNSTMLLGQYYANYGSAFISIAQRDTLSQHASKAKQYFILTEKIANEVDNRHLLFYAHYGLARCYDFDKEYKQAIQFAENALHDALQSGMKERAVDAYLLLAQVHKRAKNYSTSVYYFDRYTLSKDSLLMEQNLHETKRLQAIFETEHKQTLIDKLQQQQQLQQSELQRQELWTYSMATGAVLLFTIALLAFLKKREGERQNEEISEKADEINQQKEEITTQNTQLKDALDRLSVLTDIGQKITATMSESLLIEIIKESIEKIMPIDGIGIGVFNPKTQAIEFENFIEHGEKLPFHAESIFDELQSPALRCFLEDEELFMVNVHEELEKYYQRPAKALIGKLPQTAFFIPLRIKDIPIGVMTVQSFEKNPYSEDNLRLLRSLAAYVSIAVANSNAYKLLKDKTANIVDSMRYAKTIQNVLSPSAENITQFFTETCLVYSPRDIVSGDFYWLTKLGHYLFIAVGDCTGHGIPGAFMAMIGNTLLDELIDREKNTEPAHILDLLHQRIRKVLHQDENNNKDGMDIALCRIRLLTAKSYEITFAGAKRPLWYKLPNQNAIQEIRGTRSSLGGKQRKKGIAFEQEIIQLPSKSVLYLMTDGFADQHDPSGERIGSHNLKAFLEIISDLSLPIQEEKLLDFFENHRQGAEQRDDIAFWGVKLK